MRHGNWPEFRDWAAFADHKDVLPGLYAVEHRGGVVGKFSKADGAHDINCRLSPLVYVFGSVLTRYRNHFGKQGVAVVSMAALSATLLESSFHEISDEVANLSGHRRVLDFGLSRRVYMRTLPRQAPAIADPRLPKELRPLF
jgi:hypothetical protein